MKAHFPAGALVVASLIITAVGWIVGCYHCSDPGCSNLPPEPDPFVETVAHDAGRE